MADWSLTIPEHPDGGLVADPWEGVTVRATVHPPVRMSAAEREARWPEWPKRREDLRRLRGLAAEGRLERMGRL